jgi:hypothetical protein
LKFSDKFQLKKLKISLSYPKLYNEKTNAKTFLTKLIHGLANIFLSGKIKESEIPTFEYSFKSAKSASFLMCSNDK